tara:strand:+ start:4711 stop:5151 length:441 start_codon:yes stop_codon:yes gene_type:complete
MNIQLNKHILLGLLILFGQYVYAEPPNFDQYNYRPPPQQNIAQLQQEQKYQQRPQKPESSVNTVVDDVIDIILAQGFSGAIIIVLFGWLYRSDKNNRESQQGNIDRFQNLSIESNKILSELVAKIDGVERELEAAKTLQMLSNRKG